MPKSMTASTHHVAHQPRGAKRAVVDGVVWIRCDWEDYPAWATAYNQPRIGSTEWSPLAYRQEVMVMALAWRIGTKYGELPYPALSFAKYAPWYMTALVAVVRAVRGLGAKAQEVA